MTSGEPPTGPTKARLAGFGLIGVGVVAAVVGVSTAVSGEPSDLARPAPPVEPPASSAIADPPAESTGAPQPEVPPQLPPPGPSSSAVQLPPPQPTAPPAPVPSDVPVGSDQANPRTVVRVYNNSTIAGLAHRAAEDFRRAGYDVPEVGNYAAGRIYTTTVYFRPGTEEETQAKVVAAQFGARLEPRFQGIETASPGVIAIVTNDYKGPSGK